MHGEYHSLISRFQTRKAPPLVALDSLHELTLSVPRRLLLYAEEDANFYLLSIGHDWYWLACTCALRRYELDTTVCAEHDHISGSCKWLVAANQHDETALHLDMLLLLLRGTGLMAAAKSDEQLRLRAAVRKPMFGGRRCVPPGNSRSRRWHRRARDDISRPGDDRPLGPGSACRSYMQILCSGPLTGPLHRPGLAWPGSSFNAGDTYESATDGQLRSRLPTHAGTDVNRLRRPLHCRSEACWCRAMHVTAELVPR